ncbi:MAG: 50S ribosomal protein L25 [Planctomycetota bacterium]
METLNISVKKRDSVGSRAAKALRQQGFVPVVLYGHGGESVPLAMPLKSVEQCLKHNVRVMTIEFEGESEQALIKDLQWDTFGELVLHLDLIRVRSDEVISMSVALESKGRAKGIDEGGQLQIGQNSVVLKCLPSQIPDFIEYDVSNLGIGESLFFKDLILPEGVSLDDNPDQVIVSLTARVETSESSAGDEEGEGDKKPDGGGADDKGDG